MEKRFRQFVIASAVLAIVVELLMWFYVPEDEVLLEVWSIDGFGSLVEASLPIYVLMLTAKFLILIGLYTFNSAARTLFLFYLPFIALSTFVWGWRVVPPIIGPFSSLEIIADGVILGLAFYSPIAQKFQKTELR